jgi:hypothetical protein
LVITTALAALAIAFYEKYLMSGNPIKITAYKNYLVVGF